jgi:hypothetical protein
LEQLSLPLHQEERVTMQALNATTLLDTTSALKEWQKKWILKK